MKRNVLILAAIASIVLAGVAAYQAAAAIVRPNREGIQSVSHMQTLTSIEHARLEKDFQAFYSKPPAEQQRLREMHRALQGPGKPAHLREVSHNFYAWFSELRPRRRYELRDETDVDSKLQLVRTIQKEIEERQQTGDGDSLNRKGGPQRKKLSPQDLAKVIDVVEDKLRREDQAAAEQLDEIQDQTGYNRYFAVMSIAIKSIGDSRRGPDLFQRMRRFFADEEFAAALDVPDLSKNANPRNKDGRPPQRTNLALILFPSLHAAYVDEVKKNEPNQNDLMEHFVKLSLDDQERLMMHSSTDFMRQLKMDYIRKHPEKYPKDPIELFGDRRLRGPREGNRRRRGKYDDFSGAPPRDGRPERTSPPSEE